MTPTQIALVRASYGCVAPHFTAIGLSVYESVYRFHPELRSLFDIELTPQIETLMSSMLSTIIESLEHPALLRPLSFALGQRHASYGIRDEHYDIVGGALLTALADRLGPQFATETEAAWTALYAEVATSMIAGSRDLAQAS